MQIKVGDRLLEVGGVKTEGQDFAAILDMVRLGVPRVLSTHRTASCPRVLCP